MMPARQAAAAAAATVEREKNFLPFTTPFRISLKIEPGIHGISQFNHATTIATTTITTTTTKSVLVPRKCLLYLIFFY